MATWVLLRGLMRDSRHWYGFDQQLKQQGINVITVDMPGNGSLVKDPSPLTLDGYADAVWQQIDAEIIQADIGQPQSPLVLVGLSMGGMLALVMAQQCPQRVKQVVVINSSAGNISPWYRRFKLVPLFMSVLEYIVTSAITSVLSLVSTSEQGKQQLQSHFVECVVLNWTSHRKGHDPEVINAWSILRVQCHTSFINGLRQLYASARFSCPSLTASTPVSIIVANQDKLASPKCSDDLAVFYKTHLHKIDDCGHDAFLDQPQKLLNILCDVIQP